MQPIPPFHPTGVGSEHTQWCLKSKSDANGKEVNSIKKQFDPSSEYPRAFDVASTIRFDSLRHIARSTEAEPEAKDWYASLPTFINLSAISDGRTLTLLMSSNTLTKTVSISCSMSPPSYSTPRDTSILINHTIIPTQVPSRREVLLQLPQTASATVTFNIEKR